MTAPESSDMAWTAQTSGSKRRRIPDALRQRIEVSCDRCKTRKRRCIRPQPDEDCVGCQEAQSECRSTLPRKRRRAPPQPIAHLSLLESIARKLFPDAEVTTLAGLRDLARKVGAEDSREEDAEEEGEENNETKEAEGEGPELHFLMSELPEGWLVDAPKGGSHYVGPASLVYFARCARELVAKLNMGNQPAYDEAGLRRYLQAAEFTSYKTSHTIEAAIQGHPATVAFDAQNDPSPASVPDPRISSPSSLILPRTLPRETSDQLVNAYFERVNVNFPILHRAAFTMQYHRTLEQTNTRSEPGWTCTLSMVYTLGAQALELTLPTSHQIQQEHLSNVLRDGLGRLCLTSTLSNVQALLLLALYQHNAGERNTAWVLIGLALRSAVALGLHRDGENSHLDPFERNIRRTVWWQLHIFEQVISLALGRPSFSDAINVTANIPEPSYEAGIGLPQSYIEHSVSLSRFVVRIKQAVGALSVVYADTDRLVAYLPAVMAIHAELIEWKRACHRQPSLRLTDLFATPSQRRAVFMLSIWADYLESVLCRPYLLCRVAMDIQTGAADARIEETASLSVSAAQASITKLLMLAEHHLLEGSVWLDFYCAQHAIMITSLHLLCRPTPTSNDEEMRESIGKLIDVVKQTALAPTFRITMNVALQLACIAGLGPSKLVQVPDAVSISPPQTLTQPVDPNGSLNGLEHLLGPLPPSAFNEPGIFGDHVNFGFTGNDPWDFFNLGSFDPQASVGSIPNL